MHWDLFCRVVDNFGDIGVCWRLASNLAARGEVVRLFCDDSSALEWMAPGRPASIQVLPWHEVEDDHLEPIGDVVIEAFGCTLPDSMLRRMATEAATGLQHVWINLEYLSAEADVERSHRLPSPQLAGPGIGLQKWFFYPGFTARTGGLLREESLLRRSRAFDKAAWLQRLRIDAADDELLVSVFCYDASALPGLLQRIGAAKVLLLVTPAARAAVRRLVDGTGWPPGWRMHALPWLSQLDYDHLLWSCDLNLVRGEDSFVRAQWAAKPFVWQIYPQSDAAHVPKLDAFLERHLAAAPAGLAAGVSALWNQWNGLPPPPMAGAVPATFRADWTELAEHWCDSLAQQPDLASQLIEFARERR